MDALGTAQPLAAWVLDLAAALACGAGLALYGNAGRESDWARQRVRALRLGMIGGASVGLLAAVAVLVLEAAAMAEVPLADAGPAVWSMLTATHFGTAWSAGCMGLAACLGAALLLGRRARLWALVALGGLGIFWYTRSMASHAASEGDLSLAMLADWLHLAFVSAWIGILLAAAMVALAGPPPADDSGRRDRADYVAALSTTATVALVVIVATGAFSAWRNLAGWHSLTGTPYGHLLLGKLSLVGLAAALGGYNRFVVMAPWLAREAAGQPPDAAQPRRFRTVLRVEAMVLLLALGLAVILASTAP